MALLWESSIGDNHYAVRNAGASLRLYRNGVHHSQWNPRRPLTGGIWDLLALPAAWARGPSPLRVLILGFGAGATARILDSAFGPVTVTGVELDPVHLSVARGFFDCGENHELIQADAVEWLAGTKRRWDYIVDDLYGEQEGTPVRMAPMDTEWVASLLDHLEPGGTLVCNHLEPRRVCHYPLNREPQLAARFLSARMLRIDGYDNRVLAYSGTPQPESAISTSLHRIRKDHPSIQVSSKRYRITSLQLP